MKIEKKPIAYINRNLYAPNGGLRVRAKYYEDGTILFDVYRVDDRQQVIWSMPISEQSAAELDWTINTFGHRIAKDGQGWTYKESQIRDNNEDSSAWIARHITPLNGISR